MKPASPQAAARPGKIRNVDEPPATDIGRRAPAVPRITSRCTGCGRCVAACPPRVLWLDVRDWKKAAVLHDPVGCTGCSRCVPACPFEAIHMTPR